MVVWLEKFGACVNSDTRLLSVPALVEGIGLAARLIVHYPIIFF